MTAWWHEAHSVVRQSFKFGTNFEDGVPLVDHLADVGVSVLEVFSPAESGDSYHGLSVRDHYRPDPRSGTMDDFRRLVDHAHARRLRIITFDNVGYCCVDAPHFQRACDDVRHRRDTREARWFLWADAEDAPPPPGGDRTFLIRPPLPDYNPLKSERWVYSERAERFYWTRWKGEDAKGNPCRFPQYDWSDPGWREEAEAILTHWLATGIDGMVVDAPNWYVGLDWARCRSLRSVLGDRFAQPEGAGGFGDDPVDWVIQAGWNCIQDYGLGIWWESGSDVVRYAIETGDPSRIEPALRAFHDRVAEAGAALYWPPPKFGDPARDRLAVATVLASGTMALFEDGLPELGCLLRERTELPKLAPRHPRQSVDTGHPSLYAVRRGDTLAVLNFAPATVRTQVAGCRIELPPYGYQFIDQGEDD